MRNKVSDNLKKYLLGSRAAALGGVISLIKSDLRESLADYMTLSGEVSVTADLDEITGDVLFNITFAAKEVYDSGDVLK